MRLDDAVSRMIGLVATAAAYYETSDFILTLERLLWAAELRMIENKTDFAALAETKRRRIMGRL
ncbi:MAG: hypothetical protein EG823_00260 [Actinobacteria bacterium]|nr:hypothetical protein [Actinomycetota bacterium]